MAAMSMTAGYLHWKWKKKIEPKEYNAVCTQKKQAYSNECSPWKLPHPLNKYIMLWFNFISLCFGFLLMYDNELKTKINKIETKDKTEPQHIHTVTLLLW